MRVGSISHPANRPGLCIWYSMTANYGTIPLATRISRIPPCLNLRSPTIPLGSEASGKRRANVEHLPQIPSLRKGMNKTNAKTSRRRASPKTSWRGGIKPRIHIQSQPGSWVYMQLQKHLTWTNPLLTMPDPAQGRKSSKYRVTESLP
jgi:hypothetical protein